MNVRADPLREAVYRAQAAFGRVGASYALHRERPAGHEVVTCEELLDVANLRTYFTRAISEWSADPGEEDQRAAASRFLRRYVGAISAASLMPLTNGVAIDVSIPRVSLVIRRDLTLGSVVDLAGSDIVVSPDRPTTWPVEGTSVGTTEELRAHAFASLFAGNLVPAFDRIQEAVGVGRNLLWSTAAECIEYLYENGHPFLDAGLWSRVEEDRAVVHGGDTVPGIVGPNPMKDQLSWERFDDLDLAYPVQVRRVCCVNYVIPGRKPSYCRTCGVIDVEERHELWRQYVEAQRDARTCIWPPTG